VKSPLLRVKVLCSCRFPIKNLLLNQSNNNANPSHPCSRRRRIHRRRTR
jgi:hypothetical protein